MSPSLCRGLQILQDGILFLITSFECWSIDFFTFMLAEWQRFLFKSYYEKGAHIHVHGSFQHNTMIVYELNGSSLNFNDSIPLMKNSYQFRGQQNLGIPPLVLLPLSQIASRISNLMSRLLATRILQAHMKKSRHFRCCRLAVVALEVIIK